MAITDNLKHHITKSLRITAIVLASVLALLLFVTLLLYLPPIQNWAVNQVATYASKQTGMDIHVDHVNLVFPLDLEVKGIRVMQPNDTVVGGADTVAHIRRTMVDVQLLPLFRGVVNIDQLSLDSVRINTANLIHEARIKGSIGKLDVASHGIDLGKSNVHIDKALLDGARLKIELSDTVPPDTTESQNYWKIAVANLCVARSTIDLHLPGDTLAIGASIGRLTAQDGFFDLYSQLYRLGKTRLVGGTLAYNNRFIKPTRGMDYNHLSLQNLSLTLDSMRFQAPSLALAISQGTFSEKCGLQLTGLRTTIMMDSASLHIPTLLLTTTASTIKGSMAMDLNALDSINPGKMDVALDVRIGKHDIASVAGVYVPEALMKHWPNQPLQIDARLKGNMAKAHISQLRLALPTAFDLNTNGFISHINEPTKLSADLNIKAQTYHLNFITQALAPSLARQVRLPYGMRLKSHIQANGSKYGANFHLAEGKGSIAGSAHIDTRHMAYTAQMTAHGLQTNHFMPSAGVGTISATIAAKGVGTDPLSPTTRLQARAKVDQLNIAGYQIGHTQASINMANGRISLNADGNNPLFNGQIGFDGMASNRRIRGTLICNLDNADLGQMGITKQALRFGVCSHIDIDTNLSNYLRVVGNVGDIHIHGQNQVFRPEDIDLDVLATRDTTHAVISSGDFRLDADAKGDYNQLLRHVDLISQEVKRQTHERYIDQIRIRQRLPKARIYLNSGRGNAFARFLKWNGYEVARLLVDISSSPQAGVNGHIDADSLVAANFLIDTVRVAVKSDSVRTMFDAHVRNNKQNPDYTFSAQLKGGIFERGAYASTQVYDADDRLGLRLGLAAAMQPEGIGLHLYGEPPILGYKQFTANADNYILFADNQRISANLRLRADDGMGIQLYSDNDNTDALQDLTLSLAMFDLHKVLSVIPYTPDIEGLMNGDFHIVKTADQLSISSAVSVDGMKYEQCAMGNLGSEFVYMPKDDGSHTVDGILLHDGDEVGTIRGTYKGDNGGTLDATLGLQRLPMQLINGFIPDRIIGLRGYGEGTLSVRGSLSSPVVDGEVYLDSTYLFSEPYGVQMRFADDPVRIVGSRLLFENFEMFANNDAPLNISGQLDFTDLANMMLNIRMRAENFKIIDAKENARSEAYGKAFVNFYGMMNGPLDNLRMRGKLDVLGNTDMTYVMRDAELTADSQLDELVHFTNFKDTTSTQPMQRPAIRGLDMELSMTIDEGAHIMCMLNADHSNYVSVMGGGDLRMRYNPVDNLTLTGRYTLTDGEMKYSLPIIPLKTFTIQDGSYIEFTGDPMNPRLNITATERVKANVSESNASRAVDFDCGVKLTQTLNNLGLEFIIDAPNDMTISDQLKTMTTEGRSKAAVTMLASGMYLTDGNTSQFTMNSALSSFLQSEINNVAGKAMRSMGLDLGMSIDNTTTSGGMHTDYNFKFSKRLWNNRLSVNVGGKVSTGADIDMQQGNDNTFFNNVELEYRLDQNASKYLRLFYDNNKYDWLEGPLGEYGVGFVWKRKLRHFRDIFFLDKKEALPTNPAGKPAASDSLRQKGTQPTNNNDNEKNSK